MAFPAAATDATPAGSARTAWQRALVALQAYPVERLGLACIAAGLVLRLMAPFFMDLRSDGNTYAAMGHAWALRHEFLMPYGDVTTWVRTDPQYSNHYPPAYPFFLGLVYTVFGFGLWQTKWAAVVVSVAALGVVYWATRDLYGRVPAALAAGLMALEPHLLWVTGAGFSENMVLLFFALTMWAILKSLKDDRFIVFAGLFAGLAYLSRASVGYFFVVAGAGGFLWRFYYKRWRLFTNVWYMLAIAVFGTIVLLWAWRNASLFPPIQQTIDLGFWRWEGEVPAWETSSYTRWAQKTAMEKPEDWRHALGMKVPLFLAFLAYYVLPMLPESWRATKRIREEHTSALWLSVFLVFVIAWAFSAMFWVVERSGMYWLDNHRYVVIGLLPLAWLVLREARTGEASFRLRFGALAVSLFVACAATLVSPVKFSDLHAAERYEPYFREGDEVAVDGGTIKYAFYAYLDDPHAITVYGWWDGESPDWIFSLKNEYDWDARRWNCGSYEGYERVGEFRQDYWTGGEMLTCVFAKPEIVRARDVPTGVVWHGPSARFAW